MYTYIYMIILFKCLCLFRINVIKLCKPLSTLDLPTLHKGSEKKEGIGKTIKNWHWLGFEPRPLPAAQTLYQLSYGVIRYFPNFNPYIYIYICNKEIFNWFNSLVKYCKSWSIPSFFLRQFAKYLQHISVSISSWWQHWNSSFERCKRCVLFFSRGNMSTLPLLDIPPLFEAICHSISYTVSTLI